MKLSESQANAVARGAKTELRRPRRGYKKLAAKRMVIQFDRDRTYEDAPAKHAEDAIVTEDKCHVRILDQVESTLGRVTEADARAEGFASTGRATALRLFREWWEATHGEWRDDLPVWIVRLEVAYEDRDEFLAPVGGYTHSKSRAADPLPVVPRELLRGYAQDNHDRFAATHRDETGQRDARSSLERLKRLLRLQRGDPSAVAIIQRHIDACERELKDRAA